MAGRKGQLVFGETDSLVAVSTSDITVAQIVAAANHAIKITGFMIFGDSVDLDATPIPGELLRQTTAGTMSAGTVTKRDDSNGDTFDTTGQHTATAEPTGGDVLFPFQFAPSAGFVYTFPPGDEIVVGAGDRVGLKLESPAAGVNVNGAIFFEE